MALAVIGTAAEPRAANIAVAVKPALKNFDILSPVIEGREEENA
jgi:hypothetical protein